MGIDAGIFAKKAKKYFWFDRLKNISKYSDVYFYPEDSKITISEKEYDKLEIIRNRLCDDSHEGISLEEILPFLQYNLKCWESSKEEIEKYHSHWIKCLILFVKDRPDDLFFVSSDNQDAFDLINQYEEVFYNT